MEISLLEPATNHGLITARQPADWQALGTILSTFTETPTKEASQGWCPATFRNSWRNLDNVEKVYFLGYDLDHSACATPEAAAQQLLAGKSCIIHTTYSHSEAQPKYRAVLQLSRPVSREEFYKIQPHFAGLLGSDANAKDASRFFYLPSHPPGGRGQTHIQDGAPIDVDALLSQIQSSPQVGTAHLADLRPLEIIGDGGGRNSRLTTEAGKLRRMGFDESLINTALGNLNQRFAEPLSDEEVAKIAKSVARYLPEAVPTIVAPAAVVPLAAPTLGTGYAQFAGDAVLSGADLLAPISDPVYVIPGLRMCAGRPSLFIGPPGCGKTTMLQELALSVAQGSKIWGNLQGTSGTVLHLDFEQGKQQTARRYQELVAGRLENLRAFDTEKLKYIRVTQWYLQNRNDSATGLERMRELITQFRPTLVVIDCLKAAVLGVDENDSRFAEPIRMLSPLSEQSGAVFVVLHHTRKDGEGIRGTGDIEAASGEVFTFTSDHEVLHSRTQTDCAWKGPLPIKLTVGMCLDSRGIPIIDGIKPKRVEIATAPAGNVAVGSIVEIGKIRAEEELVLRTVSDLERAKVTATQAEIVRLSHLPAGSVATALNRLENRQRLYNYGGKTIKDQDWHTNALTGPAGGSAHEPAPEIC